MRYWIPAMLLASAAAIATPALAQDRGHWQHGDNARHGENAQRGGGDRGGRGDGGQRGDGRGGAGWQHDGGQRAQQAPAARAPEPAVRRGEYRPNEARARDDGRRGGWQGGASGRHVEGRPDNGVQVWRDQSRGNDRGDRGRPQAWAGDRGGVDRDRRADRGRDRTSGNWSRGWRQDNRYDWRGWRNSHRDAYRAGRYRAPYGYYGGYRRWGVGARIGAAFYAQQYWIDDPWEYRLPPAYGPYRWVRYYNDALLIDIYSGYVVDEIPDFFW